MEDQREHIQGQREHVSEDSGLTRLGKKTLMNTPNLNVMHHSINTSIRMLRAIMLIVERGSYLIVVERAYCIEGKSSYNSTRPYTLPPSRGRVGRSGMAQKTFTFCLAGAEVPKSLANQKCYGPTDRPTDRQTDTVSSRVACPRLKM